MSKIVVLVQDVPAAVRKDAVASIRKLTRRSISEIAQSIRSGEPITIERLFENNHNEAAARLRELISALAALAITPKVFELAPDQDFGTGELSETEISTSTLLNILDAHEEQLKHQQEMWEKHRHV
jgi:hypothetical protein